MKERKKEKSFIFNSWKYTNEYIELFLRLWQIPNYRSPEEILPDLTVQSAKTLASSHLKRFPSDLLESSVDPVLPLLSNNPKDFQETQSSTLTETEEEQAATEQHLEPSMVRVYNQPAVTHRGQTPTSSVHLQPQPLNGFQVRNFANYIALRGVCFTGFTLSYVQDLEKGFAYEK